MPVLVWKRTFFSKNLSTQQYTMVIRCLEHCVSMFHYAYVPIFIKAFLIFLCHSQIDTQTHKYKFKSQTYDKVFLRRAFFKDC